jgi:hypothetical protein
MVCREGWDCANLDWRIGLEDRSLAGIGPIGPIGPIAALVLPYTACVLYEYCINTVCTAYIIHLRVRRRWTFLPGPTECAQSPD